MRVHALGLEARFARELAQDEEGSGPRERAAFRVEKELRTVPAVEMRASSRQVTAECLDRFPADRDDPLLAALADRPDQPLVEVDAGLVDAESLADPQPGAVEELDERAGRGGGVVPAAAWMSRSASAGARARGRRRVRRGSSSSAAGFESAAPIRTRWRKNERSEATRLAIVAPESPCARSSAT